MKDKQPEPASRRVRVNLHFFFALIAFLSIPLAWTAIVVQRAREQRAILEHFDAYEPVVEFSNGNVTLLGFGGNRYLTGLSDGRIPSPNDDDLVYLKGFPALKCLYLDCSDITDKGMLHLQHLHALESLTLVHTQVTDAGLVYLYALKKLGFVNLDATNTTDEGVAKLQRALPDCQIRR